MIKKISQKFKNLHINNRKKGVISLQFVIVSMVMVVLFTTILTEFQHHLIIRNIEATADLAAVETLRAYVDEEALRDEQLSIKEEDLPKIKEDFLKKIRENLPSSSFRIERIEIPTIVDGVVRIEEDYENQNFPNSTTNTFSGPHATMVDGKEVRTEYYVGGNSTDSAAFSIVKDLSNLATSGTKPKTSYMLTSKVTVIFQSTSLLNRMAWSLTNYVDIFTDRSTSVITQQRIDKNTVAVTIQAIGKVTLR